MQRVLQDLLRVAEDPAMRDRLAAISTMPMGMGGGGIRSATRAAPCAYWASWADALPMLRQRNPVAASHLLRRLVQNDVDDIPCLRELQECRLQVVAAGFDSCPSWEALWDGARPEQPNEPEPGEWRHGWQYHACSRTEKTYREHVVMPALDNTTKALLRLQSGRCSGRHLALAGRLLKRGTPVERMWARVCREGGARVQTNVFLRDMNLDGIRSSDGRRLEVVANGLPTYHGAQLAIDATIVSPVTALGQPVGSASEQDGVALRVASRRKRTTLPIAGGCC